MEKPWIEIYFHIHLYIFTNIKERPAFAPLASSWGGFFIIEEPFANHNKNNERLLNVVAVQRAELSVLCR